MPHSFGWSLAGGVCIAGLFYWLLSRLKSGTTAALPRLVAAIAVGAGAGLIFFLVPSIYHR